MNGNKFSQVRCRELAATQRLMMEMPESGTVLMTRIATIVASDYDGTLRLQDMTNRIFREAGEPPLNIFQCDIANCPNREHAKEKQ